MKQALPQVLMPKAGVEGKAARNRAPQGDFVEALGIGKLSKQPRPAEIKADRQEIGAKPLWQRLAAKLDTADRTGNPEPEAAAPTKPAGKEASEDRPAPSTGDDAEATAPPVAGQAVDQPADRPANLPAQPPAPPPSSAPTFAETPQQPASRAPPLRESPPVSVDVEPVAASPDSKALQPAITDAAPKTPGSAAPVFVPMSRGEPAGPIRFEPVATPGATPAAGPAEQVPSDPAQAKDPLADASAEPPKATPRVTVLAQQSIPAPMPSTAVLLAESIVAGDLLAPARSLPALDAIHASTTHASAQSLKIQLHPAELGMVTATLRFAGEQLSIELQVENHDAYRRLSGDSDTIVKSLRDIGYEVDRVTVLQPSIATTPAGRSDSGGALPSPQGRAPEQFGSGAAPGGNGGSGGRQPAEGGNAERSAQ
ncbi:MAG TPA: flagellar hook-length control protein FliK, partial [Rhizobiaceae bacterium]